MKNLYLLTLLLSTLTVFAQNGIDYTGYGSADQIVTDFMNAQAVPGLSIAVSRDGKIKYSKSFGEIDTDNHIATQPYNLFRIASVSKPITAIAIMKMIEEGRFNLTDKVFGASGILKDHPQVSTYAYTDIRIDDITVQNLLEHTAGWDRGQDCFPNPTTPYPYYFSGCDPINAPLHVTEKYGATNPITEELYIRFLLENGLDHAPGTQYAYSNIGYLVLGEIIEQYSGMTYEAYLQTQIMQPLGIYDMEMGKNLPQDFNERESLYYGFGGYTNLSVYGTGQQVPWEYGGMNIEAMDAHGGWIATARDLVKLLNAVDGFSTSPDILSTSSIQTMITPSTATPGYAKGWSVSPYHSNWWHSGGVPGTASYLVRTSGGFNFAIILNTRNDGSANFWTKLDALGFNVINAIFNWPNIDLGAFPKVNATAYAIQPESSTSVTVNWDNGDGGERLVVVRESTDEKAYPLDGTDYAASTIFTSGDAIGTDNYVVYNGSGSTVTIQGLDASKNYKIRVIEYNKNTVTDGHALYLLGGNVEEEFNTSGLSVTPQEKEIFSMYPVPAHTDLNIQLLESDAKYEITSINGQLVKQGKLVQGKNTISIAGLPTGVFLIKVSTTAYQSIKKVIVQ